MGHAESLQGLDGHTFEEFVADLWERQGYDTQVTSKSRDAGVDVIADQTTPVSQRHLIQAKCHSNTKVTGPDIQQYRSLRDQKPEADAVIVVTTGEFTDPAQNLADDLNVKLVDGDDLSALIDDVGAVDLVREYTGSDATVTQPTVEPATATDSTNNPSAPTVVDEASGAVGRSSSSIASAQAQNVDVEMAVRMALQAIVGAYVIYRVVDIFFFDNTLPSIFFTLL